VNDRAGELHRRDLDPDPLNQFRRWFEEASAAGVRVPEAMALATSTASGAPSVRMVLLKGADEDGFSFYTGYVSRKAAELDANPRAALLFYWDPLGRQVRIEGTVERVPQQESDSYFATRARGSQIAATASGQSSVLAGREELDSRVAAVEHEYADREVPRPEHWGGYRLVPDAYEFWQHRDNRLHDRLRYRHGDAGWTIERLSP
jgi:pyridoxamine-phosphate oxidase